MEAINPGSCLQPSLRGQILSIRWRLGAKVAKQRRLELAIESDDRPLRTSLRRSQRSIEPLKTPQDTDRIDVTSWKIEDVPPS